ncbi:hypothetical protein COMA2_230005 [Candidatus Nitrospira nitrificans]|uniref:Uncharacterized protein n=1 Tax=Candidatus Nitrospira nitrificans TaxID=1742973 RepID=A0A0S4LHJ6_9BACT|nr:hypothetical protein COMA2_230005 [Candidatus Nitrospira nitrificans]
MMTLRQPLTAQIRIRDLDHSFLEQESAAS